MNCPVCNKSLNFFNSSLGKTKDRKKLCTVCFGKLVKSKSNPSNINNLTALEIKDIIETNYSDYVQVKRKGSNYDQDQIDKNKLRLVQTKEIFRGISVDYLESKIIDFYESKELGSTISVLINKRGDIEIWSGVFLNYCVTISTDLDNNEVVLTHGRVKSTKNMGRNLGVDVVMTMGLSTLGGLASGAKGKKMEVDFWTYIKRLNLSDLSNAGNQVKKNEVSIEERLTQLKELVQKGLISEKEYEEKKREILGSF